MEHTGKAEPETRVDGEDVFARFLGDETEGGFSLSAVQSFDVISLFADAGERTDIIITGSENTFCSTRKSRFLSADDYFVRRAFFAQ